MLKTLAITVLSLATVTACASQDATQAHDFYHQAALDNASISGGACDSVGQTVSVTPNYVGEIQAAAERQTILRDARLAGASEPR